MKLRIALIWALIALVCWGFNALAQISEMPLTPVQGAAGQADSWYEYAIKWLFRPSVAAILGGILAAFLIPQRVKMDYPIEWNEEKRRKKTRSCSFYSGFCTTLVLWPMFWPWNTMTMMDMYAALVTGLLVSVLIGAAAPFSYTIIMNQLYKRGWANEHTWSGEYRAKTKRKTRTVKEAQEQEHKE